MLIPETQPYLERKNVILARSGKQIYQASECRLFGLDERPNDRKSSYIVYRPASVLIAALPLFKTLTITKEHPPEFIDGRNYQRYAHGTTGENPEVVSLTGGNIGIKSNLVFSTDEIYNYYIDGNSQVSVGYQAKYEWNPAYAEDGYDIIMTEITTVNHLAVTAAGRGGKEVAIIDSLIGGITMLRSGIFRFLEKKGKTNDSSKPFSALVLDSVEKAKGKSKDETEAVLASVLDSLATLKDSENKTLLVDAVSDCFVAPDRALAVKAEVAKVLDSVYAKAEKETLDAIEGATKDEDGKGTGTNNVSDKATTDSTEDADAEKDKKAAEEKEKKEASKTTDSAISSLTQAIEALRNELPGLISAGVKKELGVTTDSVAGQTEDGALDMDVSEINKYVL